MEAMRNSWTDDRLDDFRAETQRRFDEVERNAERRSDEVNHRFDEVDRRMDGVDRRMDGIERRMETGFSELNARIDALHHGLRQAIFDLQRLMFRASVAGILALIAILATQL